MQIRISGYCVISDWRYERISASHTLTVCNDAILYTMRHLYRFWNLERNHVDLSSNNIYSQKGNSQPNFDENDKVYDRWTEGGTNKNEAK